MKIGLLLPSLLNTERFSKRIFAPGELFEDLARCLAARDNEVYVYSSISKILGVKMIRGNRVMEEGPMFSARSGDKKFPEARKKFMETQNRYEYQAELLRRAVLHANEKKLDVLHVYFGDLAHYFVDFANMPVVFTLHDPPFNTRHLESWRFSLFRDHNYIAISESQAKQYKKAFGMKRLEVIPHGVRLREFPFIPESQEYMALIGRYIRQKGFVEAIQIATSLKKELSIASSPNYRQFDYYKKEIKPLLGSRYIEELSYLSPEKRNEFLGKAKAFLFPLKWPEPFGMVSIEAMATGTPVIAFAEGALPEIVEDGKTGFLVKRKKGARGNYVVKKTGIAGLKEAVRRLYAMSPEEYAKMREVCRAHVEKEFSYDRVARDHERAYRKFV